MAYEVSDDGMRFNDGSLLNTAEQLGLRNAVIDGNFALNLAATPVSGTVNLSAGQYGHTMWKAGASGCSYTFATVQGITTITILSGSLMQVMEGNRFRSGTRVLSWVGSAQGRIDGGAYGASGLLGTAVGGTNQTVEFNVGTVSLVQYEPGVKPSPFHFIGTSFELQQANRYFVWMPFHLMSVAPSTSGIHGIGMRFPVEMRAVPTMGAVVADPMLTQSAAAASSTTVTLPTTTGCFIRLDASAVNTAFYATGYRFSADARL